MDLGGSTKQRTFKAADCGVYEKISGIPGFESEKQVCGL